jgi:hypothetical protein
VTDYTALSNEQLSELIHRLSVESRNRYETRKALDELQRGIDAKAPESLSKPDLDRG